MYIKALYLLTAHRKHPLSAGLTAICKICVTFRGWCCRAKSRGLSISPQLTGVGPGVKLSFKRAFLANMFQFILSEPPKYIVNYVSPIKINKRRSFLVHPHPI